MSVAKIELPQKESPHQANIPAIRFRPTAISFDCKIAKRLRPRPVDPRRAGRRNLHLRARSNIHDQLQPVSAQQSTRHIVQMHQRRPIFHRERPHNLQRRILMARSPAPFAPVSATRSKSSRSEASTRISIGRHRKHGRLSISPGSFRRCPQSPSSALATSTDEQPRRQRRMLHRAPIQQRHETRSILDSSTRRSDSLFPRSSASTPTKSASPHSAPRGNNRWHAETRLAAQECKNASTARSSSNSKAPLPNPNATLWWINPVRCLRNPKRLSHHRKIAKPAQRRQKIPSQ